MVSSGEAATDRLSDRSPPVTCQELRKKPCQKGQVFLYAYGLTASFRYHWYRMATMSVDLPTMPSEMRRFAQTKMEA